MIVVTLSKVDKGEYDSYINRSEFKNYCSNKTITEYVASSNVFLSVYRIPQ